MKWEFRTEDVLTPKEGRMVYLNRWWLCIDGDLHKALFFGSSPQCNGNKQVGEYILKSPTEKMAAYSNNIQMVFAEIAYVPKNDNYDD